MQFMRKPLLILATILLPTLLFATAVDIGILRIAGSPAPIKKILSDSGIYNSVIYQVLNENKNVSVGVSSVTLTDPAIKKAANETFTPKVVQSSTEQVINSVYDWLDGKTAQPNFRVDLSTYKTTLADKIGLSAQKRASTLPSCPRFALPSSTDPFTINCLPTLITPQVVGAEARNDVLNGKGFLESPILTKDQLKSSNSNASVFDDQLKDLPKKYQSAKATPIIFAVLSIITLVAVVLLSPTKRKGLKHAGIILLTIGVFMLIFAWAFDRVVTHKLVSDIKMNNLVLQTSVQKLTKDTAKSIDNNYWQFGAIYTILGAMAVGAYVYVGSKIKDEASITPKQDKLAENPKPKTKASK